MAERPKLNLQIRLDCIAVFLLQCLQGLAIAALVFVAGLGLYFIFSSLEAFFPHPEITEKLEGVKIQEAHGHESFAARRNHHAAMYMQSAFIGLELLLLSPLCFLVLRSLAEYVNDLMLKTLPAEESENLALRLPKSHAKEGIFETKALIVGLLFGIVSTHMVGELLSSEASMGFDLKNHAAGLILMALLATVYLAIELTASKIKKEDSLTELQDHSRRVADEIE